MVLHTFVFVHSSTSKSHHRPKIAHGKYSTHVNNICFDRLRSMSCGGVGNEKPVDDVVRELVAGLKVSVEEKAGGHFETFEPVSFATQV